VTPQEFGLLFVSVLAGTIGQLFLKLGAVKLAEKLGQVSASNFVSHVTNIITTPALLIGLTCYGMGAITYILLLTRVKLSVAAPAVAMGYVVSFLIGYFVFKEAIPFSRAVGLGLIVSGVILVVWKN